jgi:hypothetical protein
MPRSPQRCRSPCSWVRSRDPGNPQEQTAHARDSRALLHLLSGFRGRSPSRRSRPPSDAALLAASCAPLPYRRLRRSGSVLGSLVLYHIARTKGCAMMSRFPKDKQNRVKEKFRRNDILALLVAMLGPPPLPTKFFVLVAGVGPHGLAAVRGGGIRRTPHPFPGRGVPRG